MVEVIKPSRRAVQQADALALEAQRRRPLVRGGHYDAVRRAVVFELSGESQVIVPIAQIRELEGAGAADLAQLVVEAPNLLRCDHLDVHIDAGGLLLDVLWPQQVREA